MLISAIRICNCTNKRYARISKQALNTWEKTIRNVQLYEQKTVSHSKLLTQGKRQSEICNHTNQKYSLQASAEHIEEDNPESASVRTRDTASRQAWNTQKRTKTGAAETRQLYRSEWIDSWTSQTGADKTFKGMINKAGLSPVRDSAARAKHALTDSKVNPLHVSDTLTGVRTQSLRSLRTTARLSG